MCVSGADKLYKYCEEHNVPHERCGKIIVAVEESELPRLRDLYERGTKVCIIVELDTRNAPYSAIEMSNIFILNLEWSKRFTIAWS